MTDQPIDPAILPPAEPVVPPPAPPPQPMTPTLKSDRVEVIDIIRGVALFGIMAANIRGFAGPALAYFRTSLFWTVDYDIFTQAIVDTFIQGKFITIFAFLFGVGFTIQLGRAEARGSKFGRYYLRRSLLLAVIGLIHGFLIWFGDILFAYAIVGLVMLAFRKRADKTVLRWALGTFFLPIVLMTIGTIVFVAMDKKVPVPKAASPEVIQKEVLTYREGSFAELQAQRTRDALTRNYNFIPGYMWQIFSLFLFGMYAWRRGFFTPTPENLPRYRKVMLLGLTVGGAACIASTVIKHSFEMPVGPSLLRLVVQLLSMLGTPLLSLGYVCTIIVLCESVAWRTRLQRFGAVGRTALSNYLLQSIIATFIFYSYGLEQFGLWSIPALGLIGIAIYAVQALVAPWWLARYQFGPVEWLWRSATYGKLQPMARVTAPAVHDVAAA